jgi:hypothetical protein
MSETVNNELEKKRIYNMRIKIISLERENVATQSHSNKAMVNKIADIIKEEALKRY